MKSKRQNPGNSSSSPNLSSLSASLTIANPEVWIQISGASLLSGPDIASNTYGQARAQDYNDLDGIEKIRDIITSSPKRAVDNLLLNLSASQPHVRTAIIYGPLIYGLGRGPANQRSIQLPDLAKATLQYDHGIQVGKGLSCWNNIHISDLARLIVRLVQKATSSSSESRLWNKDGIYFAENGKMVRYALLSQSSTCIVC